MSRHNMTWSWTLSAWLALLIIAAAGPIGLAARPMHAMSAVPPTASTPLHTVSACLRVARHEDAGCSSIAGPVMHLVQAQPPVCTQLDGAHLRQVSARLCLMPQPPDGPLPTLAALSI